MNTPDILQPKRNSISRRHAIKLLVGTVIGTSLALNGELAYAQSGSIGAGGAEPSTTHPSSNESMSDDPRSKPIDFLKNYTGKEETNGETKTPSEMAAEEKVNELFDLTSPYPILKDAATELRSMMVRPSNPNQNTEVNHHLTTSFGPKGQYGFAGVGVAIDTLSRYKRVITVLSDVRPMTSEGVEKPFLSHLLVINNRTLDPNNLGLFFESVLLPLNTIKITNDLVYERLVEKLGQISILDLDNEISKEDSGLKAKIRGLSRKKSLDLIPELLKMNPDWKMSPGFTNIYNGYLEKMNAGDEKELLKFLADFSI